MTCIAIEHPGGPEVLIAQQQDIPTPSIGEVLIRIESDNITYTGRGADTDIIVSSAKAYINALNRLLKAKNRAS